MRSPSARRAVPFVLPLLMAITGATGWTIASTGATAQAPTPQAQPKAKPAQKQAGAKAGLPAPPPIASEQAIVVLVNDEPITAYEIEQRSRLIIMMSGAVGEYVQKNIQSRWQRVVQNSNINEEFKAFAMKNNPKSQEDVQRLQKVFIEEKQRAMRDELLREARANASKGVKSKAQEELIEEKLKLQEAKRLSVTAEDADVDNVVKDIAQRNKMTDAQFAQHIASQGGDINAMKARFRATLSWNAVIRRKFGHQISVGQREIDRMVAAGPVGEDTVELQLQRIVLTTAGGDQRTVALRLADAEKVRAAFNGCKSITAASKAVANAKVENLGARKPSTVAEPTRSMLQTAREGDLLPPTVGQDGVELYAVCGRAVVKASEEKRTAAQDELRQKEFELLAKRHLKDLRQDASIEFR